MARTRTKTNRLLRKQKAKKAAKAAVSPLASDPLVDFLTGVAKTERRQMHYEKEMERANTEIAFLREELTKLAQSTYDQITRLQDASGGIWKMRDGTLIAIRDMSDSHLANSLKLVQTNPPSIGSQGWISLFEKKIERRRVDREWARKTGHAPEHEARLEGVMGQLAGRIEKLERTARADIARSAWRASKDAHDTALDVRLQVTTALTTIRRLVGIENIDVVRSLEKLLDRVLP